MVTGSSRAMPTAAVSAAVRARLLDLPFPIPAVDAGYANVPARRAPAFGDARLLGLLSHP